ncbi:MAG: MarP family serine protease [Motilibacteraceae bacterium]
MIAGLSGLDLLLVLVCAAFAVSGFRQGFLVGLLSFAGFLGGGIVGMLVAPHLVQRFDPGLTQVVVAVAVVVGLATVGQVLLAMLAGSLRSALRWRPARMVDSVAGAALSVVSVLLVAWFVASALRQAPVPAISAQVRESRILAQVDQVMPEDARTLFGSFKTVLGDSGFPQVFGGLAPERIAPVAPPDSAVAKTAPIARAGKSVVKIVGDARSCSRTIEGSGFVFAPQHVMTNAHVVAGVRRPSVQVGGVGPAYDARVVAYDPLRDLAVLYVPDLKAAPLAFQPGASRGDQGVVAGFPRGGPYRLDAARVREQIKARGPDIYNSTQVTREVLSLYATIQPGNSGGPLLSPKGEVYGVVFAKSLDDPDTGYALTVSEARAVAQQAASATARVDTQGCAA